MKINEILNRFSFHDSYVSETIYHNNKFIMIIDSIIYKHRESFNLKNIFNDEFVKCILEFENVKDVKFESYDGYNKTFSEINYHEIIKVCINEENSIEFFLDQEAIISIKYDLVNCYLMVN